VPAVPPTLTPDEVELVDEAHTIVEQEEEALGVVEKGPGDPDEPGAPPPQVPLQVPSK
jgi:hypothetical protein